jgi:hypothetical protein
LSDQRHDNFPDIKKYYNQFNVGDEEVVLHLFVVEYDNAIQIAVYEKSPTLGSMSFGYTDGDLTNHLEIFTGKHNQFANALALILAKRTSKIIYASINLSKETVVDLDMIKKLLNDYLADIDK